jgi:hypothetical protein
MKVVSGFLPAFVALGFLGLAAPCVAQTPDAPASFADARTQVSSAEDQATDVNQVRVVRLSQVLGRVGLDRDTGEGYQYAFANFPIVQGERLSTRNASWAEVEFEDNSSLRLTPNSKVVFTALARDGSGSLRNAVTLVRGTMYVSLAKDTAPGNTFDVKAAGETVKLTADSHVRLDLYPAGSSLVVVKGFVPFTDASGVTFTADPKSAVTFGAAAPARLVEAKTQPTGLYDDWDVAAVKYHSAHQGTPTTYRYGQRDLSTYGAFAEIEGCGQVWRPYFTSAGWDPFANGVWAYYPGAGYSFASPYPWGWLPFHSGEWISCGRNRVWAWRRDRRWRALKNREIIKPIHGDRPSDKEENGRHPMLLVHDAELHSSAGSYRAFFFARDSAGLGIPRDGFHHLEHISAEVQTRDAAQALYSRDHLDGPTSDPRVAFQSYQYNRSMTFNEQRALGGAQIVANRPGESRPVMHSNGGRATSGGYGGGGGRSGGYSGGGGGGSSGASHASGGSSSGSSSSSASSGSSGSSSSGASSGGGGGGHH